MAKRRPPYTPEFRWVDLVHAGCSPEELAREFEPTAQSIRNWVVQAERDAGGGGLTAAGREELSRLRRMNRQLRLEREILSKARPGSLGRRTRSHRRVPVRERAPGRRLPRCAEKGPNAVRSDTLIPSPQTSTKPG
jgi:transposase